MSNFHKIEFKKKDIIIKKKCVLCSSHQIKQVIDFGLTPLANSYPSKKNKLEKYFNLSCVICLSCGHLQLKELINPKRMFDNYLYVSGTSKVLIEHFKNYSDKVIKKLNLSTKSPVLDIACNDGTFLEFFKKKKFSQVIGVDPARNLKKLNNKKKIDFNTGYFSSSYANVLKKKYDAFELITANNVFAHTPNIQDFTKGIKKILSKNGTFIIEVSYLLTVLKKKTFDTIYHEHMSYHSLRPLVRFFKSFNLEVYDFELIEAQGGSIRIYVCHKGAKKKNIRKINNQIKKEIILNLFSKETYEKFYYKILLQKKKLRKIITKMKIQKKNIIGYGSPAKLTTLSHVFDINLNDIKVVIDDNKLKQNRFTPGKNFKIKNFKYLIKNKTKYQIIIVLAWNFYDSIKKKCKQINRKFLFIKPFPKPECEN